jgi:hypothetical protein
MTDIKANDWSNSGIKAFWGEIAPCDHCVQIYETEKCFLDTLEGFVSTGLLDGECVAVIGTATHIEALNARLMNNNFNLEALISDKQYLPLDARQVLSKFMKDGWPDEVLFLRTVEEILDVARQRNRKLRAFGEMVAILWEQGHSGATVYLENLWHRFQTKHQMSLYCAYPKSGFTQNAMDSIAEICKAHSKILDGTTQASTEVYYKTS